MNSETTSEIFFTECYLQYRGIIRNYIAYRIPHPNEAEDLLQDVFVRLWEYRKFVNPDTVRQLLFTIAHHLIIDKVRLYYKREEFTSYIYKVQESQQNTTEGYMQTSELIALHNKVVSTLPPKRRRIYEMSFYHDLSSPAIANKLSLSVRTVEGQLLSARKSVRGYMKRQLSEVG